MGGAESGYPTRIIIEDEDAPINTFSSRNRCCCFPSSFTSTASLWDRFHAADSENRWWAIPFRALKKLREWSEIVAGPKWKTFIRRFNRNRNRHHSTAAKFQYDPLSYALNFDDAAAQTSHGHFDDDYAQFPDFSSRFAAVPISAKTSTDLGKATPVG